MAIANPNIDSLAPSYASIQNALEQRANIEKGKASPYDIATSVVDRADKELIAMRDFEKKLRSDGKKLFTPDMAEKLSKDLELDPSALQPFVGLYTTPKEITDYTTQHKLGMAQHTYIENLKKTGTPEDLGRAGVLEATGQKGFDQLAQQEFESKGFKTIVVEDPTSSTKKRIAIQSPAGVITPTQYEAPGGGSGKGATSRPLPVAERNRFDALQEIGFNLQKIHDNFSPTAIGPVAGRAAAASQYIGALSDKKQASFIQSVAALRNTIIKARSGGAVTPQEAERLINELPDNNMSVGNFETKLQNSTELFNSLLSTRKSALEESGYAGIPKVKEVIPLEAEERISVISPDGKTGSVLKSKLEKAIKAGYKLAK